MASSDNEIERAFRRVSILKSIISKERQRAEAQPVSQRNIDLGIIDPDQPTTAANKQIRETFNDLQLLLDHLHIAHMAASFEFEARPRLGKALGESRSAIAAARGARDNWPANLLRDLNSFEGLNDIGKLLNLTSSSQSTFDGIRNTRNKFSHGVRLAEVPAVDPTTTLGLLTALLLSLKA